MRSAVRKLSPAKVPAKPIDLPPGPLSNDLSPAKREAKTKRGPRGDLSPAETPTESQSPSPGVLATDHRSRDHQPTPVGGVLDSGQGSRDPQSASAAVDLDRGQDTADTHASRAPVDSLSPAIPGPNSVDRAPGADLLGTDHPCSDAHWTRVGADPSPGHVYADPQILRAGGELNGDHGSAVIRHENVAESSEGNGQPGRESQATTADPSDALLLILADRLNDLEGLRKATANQLSALTRSSDIAGGKGLSEHSKAAVSMADWLALLEKEEHQVVLQLQRALRQHPLGQWVKDTVGIGEKQGARLIAAIGNPYWNTAEDRPRRGPAELWKYCGYAPEQKRRKGVQSNWNAEAKMRANRCAENAMKAGVRKLDGCDDTDGYDIAGRQAVSPLGEEYLKARANWADRDTSDGHKHAHALRCVAKEILKDLWLAARAVSQSSPAAKTPVSATEVNESEAA